jgi:hypothetical protein
MLLVILMNTQVVRTTITFAAVGIAAPMSFCVSCEMPLAGEFLMTFEI